MIEVKKEAITKERVDEWIAEWQRQEMSIREAHQARSKEAKSLMEIAIAHYERFLIEASHTTRSEVTEAFEILPINGFERLTFVKMRPGQFACYRQLDELFTETKKRCARLRIKK